MTRRVPMLRAPLLAVALVLGLTSASHANPADAFGFGARAKGMGGAHGAIASDFSANYYNPAGLATAEDLHLDFGYTYTLPQLTLNDADLQIDETRGVEAGIVLPGKLFGHRLGLSLGLYLPDERVTRLRALPENQPRFALYDNRQQRIVLTTSLGFEVLKDSLFAGIGMTFLSDTVGRLDMVGFVDLNDAEGTTLITSIDVNFEAVRYLSAGLLVTPGDNLRVGLTFRDEFDLNLDVGVVVNGDIVLNGAGDDPSVIVEDASLNISSKNASLFSPRQLALSVAWVEPNWVLAAELTWQQWSRFRPPTAQISISLDIPILPLAIPPNPAPRPANFDDILVPRIGGEYRVVNGKHVGMWVRAGYSYEPTAAPDQPGRTNYVDTDKHAFSAGFSLRFSELTDVLPKPFYLDVAGSFILMPTREYTKDDPADPVGDYVAEGQFFTLASTLRWLF